MRSRRYKLPKESCLEETGYQSDNWELFRRYELSLKIDWTTYLFIARDCKKVTEPKLEAGEKIEARSVSFDQFITTICNKDFWASPR